MPVVCSVTASSSFCCWCKVVLDQMRPKHQPDLDRSGQEGGLVQRKMYMNFLQVGHFQVNRSADLVSAVHLSATGAGQCGLRDSLTGQERSCCVL